MASIPTMTVLLREDGRKCLINVQDYNPTIHQKPGEKNAEKLQRTEGQGQKAPQVTEVNTSEAAPTTPAKEEVTESKPQAQKQKPQSNKQKKAPKK